MAMRNTQEDIMHPCRRSRNNHALANNSDRVSYLHESVISNILSRLPTKDAVRTSVLSKNWEYKWTCMHHMDIDDCTGWYGVKNIDKDRLSKWFCDNSEKTTFVTFVDRALLQLSSNLRSFRLHCKRSYDLSHVAEWILNILGRDNIENLEVTYFGKPDLDINSSHQCLVVPLSWNLLQNSSTCLKNLELIFPCTFNVVNESSCFSNLTNLCLGGIEIVNGNHNNDKLVLTFPRLETFKVDGGCKWVNAKFVEIVAPMLSTFISETIRSEEDGDELNYDYSIKIIASKLVKFECNGCFRENIIILTESPVSAVLLCQDSKDDFDLLRDTGLRIRKLLNGLSTLQELQLSGFSALASQLGGGVPLRQHDKLRRLLLDFGVNAEQLFELLHAAPSLKFLEIYLFRWNYYNYDAVESSLPSCIVSHLEEVRLHGFVCEPYKNKLVKLLLKNGERLKNISFSGSRSHDQRNEIVQLILKSPRISTCRLNIVFPEEPCWTMVVT